MSKILGKAKHEVVLVAGTAVAVLEAVLSALPDGPAHTVVAVAIPVLAAFAARTQTISVASTKP